MTHSNDHRVHFDIPMDNESESQAPSSNAGNNPTTPPVTSYGGMAATLSAPLYQLDFRFAAPPAALPVLQPVFNFGFDSSTDVLNFRFEHRQPTPPVFQPVFDFGFSAVIEPLHHSWTSDGTPLSPEMIHTDWQTIQLWNGFGCDTSMPAFDFGWNLSPTSMPAPPVHVGYDISNRHMSLLEKIFAFQFNCQVPPAKGGDWQPIPVKAAVPVTAVNPAVPVKAAIPASAPPTPAQLDVAYTPKALPNVEFVFLQRSTPSSSSDTSDHRPSLQRVISDAERTARNIVEHLQGDEFNKLAQLMLGSIINPGDDVQHPKPDEVLDSNCVILLAFCESRNKLTWIFKDLIQLHHMVAVQARIVPLVHSLSQQVQKAEGKSGGGD
ncbi:uncharacterized protein F5147DRAFT_650030 [Suillus discolor]|uniref:Uncharacterized protein n=1 Tax=Suillus discolor TaxID=1912936 RepID=A0A9P7FFF5_9AGAM|nr:uncharacterized protein F5147DRAFT_650030 [Suillus discolor]KAG2114221.1 hypothetical protein F5147DRAFT_650030 [Suillus discolor]